MLLGGGLRSPSAFLVLSIVQGFKYPFLQLVLVGPYYLNC